MSKLNSFVKTTDAVLENRKFERTVDSYIELLSDYSKFEKELETLDNLQYKWENTLEREKYDDDELFVKITSGINDISDKLLESSKICTYIHNSPSKEKGYGLFKENFDKIKGYNLPETNEDFLNYILDYNALVVDIVVRRANSISNTDLSTLMGFDVERTPGYQ